jgi:hypothetical protein
MAEDRDPGSRADLSFRVCAGQNPGGAVEAWMGRRKRLPHTWTGESACPTFVSWRFVGRRPIRDKAEALALH